MDFCAQIKGIFRHAGLKVFALLFAAAAAVLCRAEEGPVSGVQEVTVLDGDSLILNGREIRLSGIDAPEYKQMCEDRHHRKYDCGQEAKQYLTALTSGRRLECRRIETDRYKREVAVCLADGEELNREMVLAGWAVAYDRYTQDYVQAEQDARKAKRGLWQGKFMKPELFRALNRK